jgi:hypothetical protein
LISAAQHGMPMRAAIGEVARSYGLASSKVRATRGPTVHRSSGAFATHVLEVMRAILQAGADGETIKIVSRIELPASLSDKGGGVLLA